MEDIKDVNDIFNSNLRTEEILSVSEQVQNVMDFKNMSPEDRLHHLVTKKYNPF